MASNDDSNTTTTTTTTNSSATEERPTYTIADLGLRTSPQTQQTIIGPTRSLYSLTRYEWIYLSLSLVSLVVSMAMTIERLITLKSNTSDYTFAFLLFWTICFCFVYVFQGVFRERTFELLTFVSTLSIVLFYVIFNYLDNNSRTGLKTGRLVITVIFCPLLIIGGLMLSKKYFKSQNLIFRTVGANARMQRMCEILFLAQSLLKFDVQLAGTAVILWLRKGLRYWSQIDIIIVTIGSIVTILWYSLGILAMRYENKPLIYVFFLTSIFEPIIIVWDLIRYSLGPDDMALELSVFLSGIIALIVRIATVVVMTFVMFNFNNGLKQRVFGSKEVENPNRDPIINEPIVA